MKNINAKQIAMKLTDNALAMPIDAIIEKIAERFDGVIDGNLRWAVVEERIRRRKLINE